MHGCHRNRPPREEKGDGWRWNGVWWDQTLACVLGLVLALTGIGCSRKPDDAKRIADALPMLPAEAQPITGKSATKIAAPAGNHYEMYMDISASMRPYFHPKTVVNSPLRAFLKRVANLSTSRVKTFAFGTPAGSNPAQGQPPPSEMPLGNWLKDSTYTGLYDDYAPLFAAFKPGAAVERLVISDGVLSSQASEASFLGATAGEINRWIDGGGVFALFLFRAPYYTDDARGAFAYFSETMRDEHKPTIRVAYNTPNRPFAVFAFLSSDSALDTLKEELLEGLGGQESWALEIRHPVPIRPMELRWAAESMPKAVQQRMETLEVAGVPGGLIRCPLPPDPTGKNISELQFRDTLQPQAMAAMPTKTQRLLQAAGAFTAKAWVVDILPDKGAQPAQSVTARFDASDPTIIRLSTPEVPKGRLRLWSVVLTPSPSLPAPVYDTDVAAWSTTRDDTVGTADRTLNMQALVDEICRQRSPSRLLPTSALLVTY